MKEFILAEDLIKAIRDQRVENIEAGLGYEFNRGLNQAIGIVYELAEMDD